ncbi:hypothetical protein [Streptomyces millisiae]|uniref:Uncharacterized protein n=1 Tax=Streptomyces millisiae TaxID=3075542 RepID=A0ABU2LWB3_9ACTN|nr:hypothetical protein [Streptomyces sp. DSM 44918]MDT0321885.1 hypothetical protein [Streptomyces sp. DSM 44918]
MSSHDVSGAEPAPDAPVREVSKAELTVGDPYTPSSRSTGTWDSPLPRGPFPDPRF